MIHVNKTGTVSNPGEFLFAANLVKRLDTAQRFAVVTPGVNIAAYKVTRKGLDLTIITKMLIDGHALVEYYSESTLFQIPEGDTYYFNGAFEVTGIEREGGPLNLAEYSTRLSSSSFLPAPLDKFEDITDFCVDLTTMLLNATPTGSRAGVYVDHDSLGNIGEYGATLMAVAYLTRPWSADIKRATLKGKGYGLAAIWFNLLRRFPEFGKLLMHENMPTMTTVKQVVEYL